jgi:hypothetical protein
MRTPKSYTVKDTPVTGGAVGKVNKGDTVYELVAYGYGLASDDTRATGVQHISVTFNEDGSYPSYTIPAHNLEPKNV